jgi:hypothetical protein
MEIVRRLHGDHARDSGSRSLAELGKIADESERVSSGSDVSYAKETTQEFYERRQLRWYFSRSILVQPSGRNHTASKKNPTTETQRRSKKMCPMIDDVIIAIAAASCPRTKLRIQALRILLVSDFVSLLSGFLRVSVPPW